MGQFADKRGGEERMDLNSITDESFLWLEVTGAEQCKMTLRFAHGSGSVMVSSQKKPLGRDP